MITKIKNWIIPILLFLGGSLDMILGFLTQVAQELNLDPRVVPWTRALLLLVSLIMAKIAPPSTNPDKLQNLVSKAKKNKSK